MKKLFILLAVMLAFAQTDATEPRDLVKMKQSFVLTTKQIHIPGYPEAFNPSIIEWKGRYLMSFRNHHPTNDTTDAIYLVWLDDNFDPISEPALLRREGEVAFSPSKAQDPRLIVVKDKIYIVYSNLYPDVKPVSRMIVGHLEQEGDGFKVSFPTSLLHFYRQTAGRKEKNWVPFVHDNILLLAYSLQPHRIFLPVLKTSTCLPIGSTIGTIKWDWGTLMGGTPALKVGKSYLGFFHSNKAMATKQSDGVMMNHYFMGAYTFEGHYPFAINGISPHPIVARTFYEGEMYEGQTWKPLRVVFPGGFVQDDNFVWVVYGRQDHELWVVKLDKAKLLSSLLPVNMLKMSVP